MKRFVVLADRLAASSRAGLCWTRRSRVPFHLRRIATTAAATLGAELFVTVDRGAGAPTVHSLTWRNGLTRALTIFVMSGGWMGRIRPNRICYMFERTTICPVPFAASGLC
ncbi:MAG: hypothetical protein WBV39_10585, partial [Rudaea sp.]